MHKSKNSYRKTELAEENVTEVLHKGVTEKKKKERKHGQFEKA